HCGRGARRGARPPGSPGAGPPGRVRLGPCSVFTTPRAAANDGAKRGPRGGAWRPHSYGFSVLPVIHPRQERDLLKQTDGYVRATPLTRSDRLLSSNGV